MAARRNRKAAEFELVLENVRCFVGEQVIPIRPLTLLVGENSSGKTTVLAAASVVSDYRFPMRPNFNEPPFQLGSFDTIATYKGGRSGRAKSFSLGYAKRLPAGVSVRASYVERSGEPVVSSIRMEMPDEDVGLLVQLGKKQANVSVLLKGKPSTRRHLKLRTAESPVLDMLLWEVMSKKRGTRLAEKLRSLAAAITGMPGRAWLEMNGGLAPGAVPMAPIRSRPRRTYSEITSDFDPEGAHVPSVLSRLPVGGSKGDSRDFVTEAIKKYGKASGLFDGISSKRLGKKLSSPFQILVKGAGPPVNLVDVGYGVSQALPIVVQTVLAQPGGLVLIQQPEVHLHPRAQAALGSLFVDLVAAGKQRLVIETHSDYIIDRVRMEVADGKLRPDQVVIFYFEKEGLESKVYPIHLDKLGNMLDAPRSYRSFFLKEQTAFITGKR